VEYSVLRVEVNRSDFTRSWTKCSRTADSYV